MTAGPASSQLGSLERLSTPGKIVSLLRDAIVVGTIPQGEQLREVWLAEEFRVSRGTLREALRQLVQEGLVEHHVHRGTFVRRLTPVDAVDVYQAREAVELCAVDLLVARDEAPDLSPLSACLVRMTEAAEAGDGSFREVVEPDISFHEGLVHASGSPRLVRMYSTLAAETRMILYSYPPYSPRLNVEDHRQILAALAARSGKAVTLLREHLRYSAQLAAESLEMAGG